MEVISILFQSSTDGGPNQVDTDVMFEPIPQPEQVDH